MRISKLFAAIALFSLSIMSAGADVRRCSVGADIGAEVAKCSPGDTLLLPIGSYPPDTRIRKGGLPGAPITVKSEVQYAARIEGGEAGLAVWNVPYVEIEGLSFAGQLRRGVWLAGANSCTVRRCLFVKTGQFGVFTSYSDDAVIEWNDSSGQLQHGIYVSNSGDRPVVRFNFCHDNMRAGIQLNGDRKLQKPELGTRGDGIIEGALIEGNRLENNGLDPVNKAASLNLAVVRNSTIRDNYVTRYWGGGIALFSDMPASTTDAGSTGNTVEYNVVRAGLDPEHPELSGRSCLGAAGSSTGNTWRRNVLAAAKGGLFNVTADSLPGLVVEGNVTAYQIAITRQEPIPVVGASVP